jgi:hypothetical protein
MVMSPAKHKYTSCIDGFLKIKKLSSSDVIKSIPFEKCTSKEECAKNPKKRSYTSLVIDNARKAIKSINIDIKNFFGYKGYITEERTNGEKTIVKTTLGKNHGAKKGESVNFFRIDDSGEKMVGKGIITNYITDNNSWVIVKNLDKDIELKKGDFIKIKYEKGFFD